MSSLEESSGRVPSCHHVPAACWALYDHSPVAPSDLLPDSVTFSLIQLPVAALILSHFFPRPGSCQTPSG